MRAVSDASSVPCATNTSLTTLTASSGRCMPQQRARAQQRELRHHVDVVRADAVAQRETAFEIAREPRAHRFGKRRAAGRPCVLSSFDNHITPDADRGHRGPSFRHYAGPPPAITSYGAGGAGDGAGVGDRRSGRAGGRATSGAAGSRRVRRGREARRAETRRMKRFTWACSFNNGKHRPVHIPVPLLDRYERTDSTSRALGNSALRA